MTTDLTLRNAQVSGRAADVTIDHGIITAIATPGAPRSSGIAGKSIDCGGGALLPGLHDHHLHLMAMAAADRSLQLAGRDLDAAIRASHASRPSGEWIRAVGYDEQVHGALDRWRLDAVAPTRPVRVQHRSGALWVLSSAALELLGADEPDGRLFRRDDWLRSRLPTAPPPDLAAVGRRLASYGITGVTDATPSVAVDDFRSLAEAANSGALPCTVMTTGGPALAETAPPPPLRRGPVKVVIADHDLPPLGQLEVWFRRAHIAGRPVAVHCVTRVALALALAAWETVGALEGDRVEHGAVVPPDMALRVHELRLTVVTQPGFIAAKGDGYLRDVDRDDRPHLYRCGSLLDAGIGVAGSSDAPFGPEDPWLAIRAAVERRTDTGQPIGVEEAVSPERALALYLAPLEHPGGRAREVQAGAAADLVLLDRPRPLALDDLAAENVMLTIAAGVVTHQR